MNKVENLKVLVAECNERYEHWAQERRDGCVDPNWSDGANLNLVRNHIIFYKKKIRQICDEDGLIIPAIYYRPLPPELPQDFFVRDGKNYNPARIKRILGYDSTVNSGPKDESAVEKHSEEYQMRLF